MTEPRRIEEPQNSDIELEQKSQLLSFLNEEISQIQKEESRPGLTIWALLAGIATCSWILISQIEQKLPNWDSISILIIILTFTSNSSNELFGRSRIKNTSSNDDRVSKVKDIFSRSKSSLMFLIFWYLIIWYLIHNTKGSFQNWELYSICITLFIRLFAYSVGLILSVNNFLVMPFNITSKKIGQKKNGITSFAFIAGKSLIVIGIIAVFALINFMLKENLFSIYDFKIAILIFAIPLLVFLTVSLRSPDLNLNKLIEIRRDLIIGELTITQIKQQINFILRGLSLEDYFLEEFNELKNDTQAFANEILMADKKLELYNHCEINKADESKINLTQDALYQSIMCHLIAAAKIRYFQIDTDLIKLKFKIKFISMYIAKNMDQSGNLWIKI